MMEVPKKLLHLLSPLGTVSTPTLSIVWFSSPIVWKGIPIIWKGP